MEGLVLDLDGETLTTGDARLALNLATTTWSEPDQKWLYGEGHICPHWQIDVSVDDYAGDFTPPSPTLTFLLPHTVRLPPLDAWPGTCFSDLENQRCEAFLGNDWPAIEQNELTLGQWRDAGTIEIDWRGMYQAGRDPTLSPFRLAGPVRFDGITLQVREEADAAKFLALAMPGLDVAGLEPVWGEWIDSGPDVEESRRRRRPVSFRRR